tara:strand:+ start:1875 stop:2198 length:324 start_codon:yes stop_codon:yes gene_type:complete
MTNKKLIKYAQNVEYKVLLSNHKEWEEHKFDYCTYPFELLFTRGCWIVENSVTDLNKSCEEFWKDALAETERMQSLEQNFKPNQLNMQIKILADLSACLLQRNAENS